MSATLSVIEATSSPAQRGRRPVTPLSEVAAANRQRDALYQLSEQLHRAASLQETYDAAMDAIEAALNCDRSAILLFDDAGVMQFVASRGLSPDYRKAVTGHSPWKVGDTDATPIDVARRREFRSARGPQVDGARRRHPRRRFHPAGVRWRAHRQIHGVFPRALRVHQGRSVREHGDRAAAGVRDPAQPRRPAIARARIATRRGAGGRGHAAGTQPGDGADQADSDALYDKLIDAAVSIMRSDFGSMQQYYPHLGARGELKLLGHRGFTPEAAKFWAWVRADSSCTCGVAISRRERVIAADVEQRGVHGGHRRPRDTICRQASTPCSPRR